MKKQGESPFSNDSGLLGGKGVLSRRAFMERALGAGLTLQAASMIWSSQVEAATPRKGGIFRVAISDANTTDSLDPGTTVGVYMINLNHASRSYLTEITSTNKLGPDAAESWEASSDAKVWRFKLHKGQEFHNGKALTAADVVASLNFHRSADSKSGAKGLFADVDDIKTDGDDVVVISMKVGSADVPYIMSDYHLAILPSDSAGKVDWSSGVGSGPFKVDSFRAGIDSTLSRFANYHRDSYFDGVHMIGVNDTTARVNALVTKQVDAVSSVDLKTLELLHRTAGIVVDEVPSGNFIGMPMQCKTPPFDNADVRLALKYALDREQVLKKVLYGHGTLGNDQPIGPVVPYYASLPQRSYDPDKAKYHLKKAGMSGLSVSLSTSEAAFGGAIDMALIYQQSALKAGINLNVVREPADNYWSVVWQHKPFVVVNDGQRPTPDMMFSIFFREGAPWNDTNWHNDRFQQLLLSAKSELDDTKRAAMYREMQSLCRDDGGTIVAFFNNRVYARQNNVMHGPSISSEWELDGARAYQRWWFAA
jgi:peptide/nickel transport system substrate-binding protein